MLFAKFQSRHNFLCLQEITIISNLNNQIKIFFFSLYIFFFFFHPGRYNFNMFFFPINGFIIIFPTVSLISMLRVQILFWMVDLDKSFGHLSSKSQNNIHFWKYSYHIQKISWWLTMFKKQYFWQLNVMFPFLGLRQNIIFDFLQIESAFLNIFLFFRKANLNHCYSEH